METTQEIEPYQRWAAKDGSIELSVYSVGTYRDQPVAYGVGDNGAFGITYEELQRDYTFLRKI